MQAIARKRGGRCLSSAYVNLKTKLRWRCAKGHEWEAPPANVKHVGTWCQKCSGKGIGTIEEMRGLAQKHKGECLSTTYVNSNTKLRWRCAKGHEWEATPTKVKHGGTWCTKCSTLNFRNSKIKEMQALAKKHKGECLSSIYVGVKKKLRWRCAQGHEWETTPNSIKYMGTWCPNCSGKKPRGTIKEMQALAKKRGGECLSSIYGGSLKKLRWRCTKGHEWETTPSSAKNAGYWCPECRKNDKCKKRIKKIY